MLGAEVLIFLFFIFIAFIESVKCLVRLYQHTVRILRSNKSFAENEERGGGEGGEGEKEKGRLRYIGCYKLRSIWLENLML